MERIRDRAEKAYPDECCGFLAGFMEDGAARVTVRVLEEIPARNAAAEDDRRREFLVDPKDLLNVMKRYRDRDEDVVGFYHSHPDHEAELSPTDLKFARLWPRTVWLIVPVNGRNPPVGSGANNADVGRRDGSKGNPGHPGYTGHTGHTGHPGHTGLAGRAEAGQERAWWLPGTEAGRAEMIIHSSGSDGEDGAPREDRTITPREEKA